MNCERVLATKIFFLAASTCCYSCSVPGSIAANPRPGLLVSMRMDGSMVLSGERVGFGRTEGGLGDGQSAFNGPRVPSTCVADQQDGSSANQGAADVIFRPRAWASPCMPSLQLQSLLFCASSLLSFVCACFGPITQPVFIPDGARDSRIGPIPVVGTAYCSTTYIASSRQLIAIAFQLARSVSVPPLAVSRSFSGPILPGVLSLRHMRWNPAMFPPLRYRQPVI